MNSASVLDVMPQHFTTNNYACTAGIALSSASRALKKLSGAVIKTGHGRWAKNPDERYTSLIEQPDMIRLEGFYGQTPRRISHAHALRYAGIPIISALAASSPVRMSAAAAHRRKIKHRRESETTLFKYARRLDELTWVSLPSRAIAEYAQHMPVVASDEILQRTIYYFPSSLTLQEVAVCAEDMGWRAGLRRISSVLSVASERDPAPLPVGWERFLSDVGGTKRGDKWIDMNPAETRICPGVAEWKDHERKVVWQTHPEDLYEHILY